MLRFHVPALFLAVVVLSPASGQEGTPLVALKVLKTDGTVLNATPGRGFDSVTIGEQKIPITDLQSLALAKGKDKGKIWAIAKVGIGTVQGELLEPKEFAVVPEMKVGEIAAIFFTNLARSLPTRVTLFVPQGGAFYVIDTLGGSGPFVSSQQYARVIEGMKLTVGPDGNWMLEYDMYSVRATVNVEFELVIWSKDHEPLVAFRTKPWHINETKDTEPAQHYCQTGFHPALLSPKVYAAIVEGGRLERRNASVVFEVLSQDEAQKPHSCTSCR